jgi:hypothetical protein
MNYNNVAYKNEYKLLSEEREYLFQDKYFDSSD